MATITGLTAERMEAIEAASVVDGDVVGGELILTKFDGSTINAGSVVGPEGPVGPVGSDLDVLDMVRVSDVGVIDQIRAGRELTAQDFLDLGLSSPLGLWNLSGLGDSSGNARNLTNKGSVAFALGINGAAASAALFTGSTAKALYIPDDGTASDPFRLKVGSFGCWFKTAKQAQLQNLIAKRLASTQFGYWLRLTAGNKVEFGMSHAGTDNLPIVGLTSVCDSRWHFAVATFDGSLQRLYVDAVLEASALRTNLIFGSSAPFNIGANAADASVAANDPHYGSIDEAFVTSDILTEEQIHNLYCAKISHTLAEVPSRISLNIHRCRKGASLLVSDFPTSPLRLYNFSAGSQANEGSDGSGYDLTDVGTPVSVAGVDGTQRNAFSFLTSTPSRFTASDVTLPDALESVSYGCWFKTGNGTATMYMIAWGTAPNNSNQLYISSGRLFFGSGSDNKDSGVFVADGSWHFVMVVQDNAAVDVKRKLYLDGRLISSSNTLNSLTSGGSGKFVIGATLASGSHFTGQLDSVFVCAQALTFEEMFEVYTKCDPGAAPSPKSPGDHVESMSDTDLLVTFDTLDAAHEVALKVSP